MTEKCFTDCSDRSIGVLCRLPFWLVVLIHGMVLCSSTQFSAQLAQPVQQIALESPDFALFALLLLQDPSGTFTKYVAGQNLGKNLGSFSV